MARQPYTPPSQNDGQECLPDPLNRGKCKTHDKWCRAILSQDEGNSAQNRQDGLYVPAIVYRENTSIISGDDATDIEEGVSDDDFRQFTVNVRISDIEGNILEISEEGLRVVLPEDSEDDLVFLHEGYLTYTPMIPGRGTIHYQEDRSFIRVTNNLTRIVLPVQPEFVNNQELFLVQDLHREVPMYLVWGPGVLINNTEGPAEMVFAPGSSIHLLRHTGQSWLVLKGGGVSEAPVDDTPYARKNAGWVSIHDEVLPILVTSPPQEAQDIPVSNNHFNHIVHLSDNTTGLQLSRNYLGQYVPRFEATYFRREPFTVKAPIGVRVNGVNGPVDWIVEARPKGAVLKQVVVDEWLLLGSASRDPDGAGIPAFSVLEFPGSGTFKASVKMLDGTMLYDMTNNNQMFNTLGALKNILVAMVIWDEKSNVIDNKDLVYLDEYNENVTTPISALQEEDILSWRDVLATMLLGRHEDMVFMAASLIGQEIHDDEDIGDNAFEAFQIKMMDKIVDMEDPLLSAVYSISNDVENPAAQTNVYKLIQWLLKIETDYVELQNIINEIQISYNVFGNNEREITVNNINHYLNQPNNHYGLLTDYLAGEESFGLVQKHEMPSEIPVFISMLGFGNEFYRHLAYTSCLMHLQDDFEFLGDVTNFDGIFSNVTLLLGNSETLIDRSNVSQQVTLAPVGLTEEDRPNKGWKKSWDLNGSTGWISVYDEPGLRLHDQDFTIEFIFRGKGLKGIFNFYSKYSTDSNRRSYKLRMNSNSVEFVYSFNGVDDNTIAVDIVDQNVFLNGARRNITIQRQGDLLGMFINGRLMHDAVDIGSSSFHNCDMPLSIGTDNNPEGPVAPTPQHFGLFKFDNMRVTKGITRHDMTGFPVRGTPFRTGSGS